MGRRVCGGRWDWHHHRGSPQVLDASRHHRDSHSYGGPGSMGSLGHRRDVPVAAEAAAAAMSAVSKRNQDQGESSSSRRFEPLCPGYRAHSQRPATGPRPGGRRRRRSDHNSRQVQFREAPPIGHSPLAIKPLTPVFSSLRFSPAVDCHRAQIRIDSPADTGKQTGVLLPYG